MLERVLGSVLVGWWSFFNRGNQRNFRTDQLQERVKKHIIDCCWLLFPVTDMVVSITCITNQFGIEALTNPPKKISAFDCFFFNPKNKHSPKSYQKNVVLPYQLEFHRYRRALLADHLVLSSL